MSGVNAPVAAALRAHGWDVLAIDWEIDSSMDMTCAQVQADIKDMASQCDAVMGAMDCSTLSRAREKPLAGHKHAPRPLRSVHHVKGLPGLEPAEQSRVLAANQLVEFFAQIAVLMCSFGRACILENPLRAYF